MMSRIITVPFTEEFLPHVVDYLYAYHSKENKDLSRLALVFGGRRPALFVKRDLARKIGRSYVPPQFFTIDEWMSWVAYGPEGLYSGNDLDLAYMVYQLALRLCPSVCQGRERFSEFLPWAREILQFIQQLDIEDVPLDSLKLIHEHAVLGFSVPEAMNQLLAHLTLIREAFHQELEIRHLAPRGFSYRQASRRVAQCDLGGVDQVLFCNFFYLHRTENTVIKNIFDRGQAVLFMQGDQRRWPALKRIAKTFGTDILEGKEVKPTQFNLKIYEAFDSHAQAGLVKEILVKIKDPESAVIVLPDADFLSTLLTAIGSQLQEFNISMGYPLKRSALYSLIALMMQAQLRCKAGSYYTKDYLRLLGHPLFKSFGESLQEGVTGIFIQKVNQVLKGGIAASISGRIFIDLKEILQDDALWKLVITALEAAGIQIRVADLKEMLSRLHVVFFESFSNLRTTHQLGFALTNFISVMQDHGCLDDYLFNPEIALRILAISEELKSCAFAHETFESRELFKVLDERLSSQLIAFSGSPLRGLQVLGLFETRSLNFKHVIVVDLNEGLLPSLNIYEPLIPREVMIKLNLDRLELEEEIQRYGFMRLISAADDVHLIYQQNTDRTRSRFLEELIWEQEQRASCIGVMPVIRGSFEVSVIKNQRQIPKTPSMIDYLKNLKYSATSINTYLKNPYTFYCRYVLGLRQEDDLLEDLKGRHIGIFIHQILEEAFRGFIGKKPLLDDAFMKNFQKIYAHQFAELFGRSGRTDLFLMEAVLKTRLERFLVHETLRCENDVHKILFLEHKFEEQVQLAGHQVRFNYRVDRIDHMKDGSIFAIDYKTAHVELMPKVVPVDTVLSRAYIRDQIGSFQMPLYLRFLKHYFPDTQVDCALYYLRTMQVVSFLGKDRISLDVDQLLTSYERALDFIMAEIFNLEIPFIDEPIVIK